ncbi:helix-turn-helix transcriptional regulator [uncultured Microscilla sp.]|uniref:helix-turn-helix domain-containing protein n=1 Tax=uncultured Microscilla sp. TaxID=432653 RepID=UPI00261503C2|nr:helix-turn-helix transcriptional regulator [uncultured Microscilla sp.]
MNQLSNIGANIKAYRKANKLSQGQLAEKLGVHLTHISRIENGKYKPSIDDLIKLSSIFEVSIDDIVKGKTDEKHIEDDLQKTPLYEKIKMIEELAERDKSTILNVIDSMLTKKKFKDFLEQQFTS